MELLTVIGLLAVAGSTFSLLTRPSFARDEASIGRLAEPLSLALKSWQSSHPKECPTLGLLAAQGFLDPDTRRDDPWGGRFRVGCDDEELSLISPGPDGALGTKDDARIAIR
jgi:hypothetical protein